MQKLKLLIAIDCSIHSTKAAKYGLDIATKINADVGIVYVLDQNLEIGNIDCGIFPEDARMVLHKEALLQLENIRNENPKSWFESFVIDGKPEIDILKFSDDWKANMLIIGSHGKTGILSRLMGSITEVVIRNATIPVIIITPNMNLE